MEFKKFKGSPFGVQKARFDVAGVHPKAKQPWGFTELPYDRTYIELKTRRRGPGLYYPYHNPHAEQRASEGPGWARQEEVEALAAMPNLLHKELFEHRRELKRKVGPGSYNFKDFIALDEKPGSILGICEPRAARFGRPAISITPGPGTYGKGGIPHTALEEKNRQSTSTKGMLDTDCRASRYQLSVGCCLGPGTYTFVDSIDKFLNKMVSIRGPYDLSSGNRGKPISTGHFAAPAFVKLGPGQYDIGSCIDEWSAKPKNYKGRFGKVAQYPRPPAERMYHTILSQCPKEQHFPGPGAHSPSCPGDWPKVRNSKKPAFLSTSARVDRRAQRFFTGNYNSVGVGRYFTHKYENAQQPTGHKYIFKSKRAFYPPETFLRERLRAKDIPVTEKSTAVQSRGLPFEARKGHLYDFSRQNVQS